MFRTLSFCTAALAVVCLLAMPNAANAGTVRCDVTDDGYLPVGMGNWYWGREYAKSYRNLFGMGYECYGFTKFDLGLLSDFSPDDIISANFRFYVTGKTGAGPSPYPNGTEGQFSINAYDDTLMLDESYVGADRPDYTGIAVTQSHNGGPNTWVSVQMTDILKNWMAGTYVNNGIEIYDGIEDDYGWYWNTKEAQGNTPYLEVEVGSVIPEPMSMVLFGTGLVGMMGYVSRRRMQKRM